MLFLQCKNKLHTSVETKKALPKGEGSWEGCIKNRKIQNNFRALCFLVFDSFIAPSLPLFLLCKNRALPVFALQKQSPPCFCFAKTEPSLFLLRTSVEFFALSSTLVWSLFCRAKKEKTTQSKNRAFPVFALQNQDKSREKKTKGL